MRMSDSKLRQFRMREVRSTSLVLLSAKTRFAPLDVILHAAYSLRIRRNPSYFTSRAVTRHEDFSAIYIMVSAVRIVISICDPILNIMDANIGESYSCGAFTKHYRFHLFRNVARNTFRAVPFSLDLFFRKVCFSSLRPR